MAKKSTRAKDYPYTIEAMAKACGMTLGSFRGWKLNQELAKKLPRPSYPTALCIQDPKSRNRLLYSKAYFEKLIALRQGQKTRVGKTERKSAGEYYVPKKHGIVLVKIPPEDRDKAKLIFDEFGWEIITGL